MNEWTISVGFPPGLSASSFTLLHFSMCRSLSVYTNLPVSFEGVFLFFYFFITELFCVRWLMPRRYFKQHHAYQTCPLPGLFTAASLLTELPDTLSQRVIYHWRCTRQLSAAPSPHPAPPLDLELSIVITPALASWLHKLKRMNFKLKFLTFISLQRRRRTKKRIFGRLYLHEMGNATHDLQVLIRSQKKWLAVLGSCLTLRSLL